MVDIQIRATPRPSFNRATGHPPVKHEWFVEPRRAIDALLDVEADLGTVWDPCCGSGNIPQACLARGILAIGTDIVDRGYGKVANFFDSRLSYRGRGPWPQGGVGAFDALITNPPFTLAADIVLHALRTYPRARIVAILARSSLLEGVQRHTTLFAPYPPARVWQFSWRVSCPPGGTSIAAKGGSVPYSWLVWDRAHAGPPHLGWLT